MPILVLLSQNAQFDEKVILSRCTNRFNPKDNCKVCCWVLSGMSTSSDFDVNTVHHDDTDDAAKDHIVENIVRQPINVGQWVLVTL